MHEKLAGVFPIYLQPYGILDFSTRLLIICRYLHLLFVL